MRILPRILAPLVAATAMWPFAALTQSKPLDAADEISRIIYSDLSKSEMLEQLSPFVRVGDKLEEFTPKTGLDLGFCMEGGPGVVDCHLANGLQLVADPDGMVQLIRRNARLVGDTTFNEMSISTHILHWKGYARGYPE